MAPLILHNVPDEELYVGDDGVQRPYAMVFPQQDSHQATARSRRAIPESGSFGKSTRRSRSKPGTPARREDPTIAAADKVFSAWIQTQVQDHSSPGPTASASVSGKKQGLLPASASQPNLLTQPTTADETTTGGGSASQSRFIPKKEPTEVVLRGYRSANQQYAAISRYEQLAGRICEDYPREPPLESRRYKSELRDPALARRRPLTPEERARVNRADGGEHWVKVTFESAEAAEAAIYASPQSVLGHLVFAEPYRGIPPARDEAIPDTDGGLGFHDGDDLEDRLRTPTRARRRQQQFGRNGGGGIGGGGIPRSQSAPVVHDTQEASPASSRTADTTTIGSTTASSTTLTGTAASAVASATGVDLFPSSSDNAATTDNEFCRTIPTARRVKLLPAEQALLPQPSYTQRVLNRIPFLRWFSGSMIGNEVPRTETGEFDWDRASLYWKFICWLDSTFGLFGGEILNADKDD
ncbi:hypothetical protein VTK73DRAFT_2505 [Phialemonium thermophilum]|uniref:Nucleoporin NUP53 n=1 Tax=Phialemonium thermophilum TaxID=223376 RepID=A0ABR3Y1D3_9PEZI